MSPGSSSNAGFILMVKLQFASYKHASIVFLVYCKFSSAFLSDPLALENILQALYATTSPSPSWFHIEIHILQAITMWMLHFKFTWNFEFFSFQITTDHVKNCLRNHNMEWQISEATFPEKVATKGLKFLGLKILFVIILFKESKLQQLKSLSHSNVELNQLSEIN